MKAFQNVKPGQVLGYMVLPGIVPRLKAFSRDGFGWLALLMAQIYAGVRLLPAQHPYLNPLNRGKFGIRHVVAEAGRRLVFSRQNIDQILVFFTLLAGFVLLVLQGVMLLVALVFKPALAANGIFDNITPQNDIAFLMLDQIFGIPGLFGSAAAPTGPATVPAFNIGLQNLFSFYSYALLIVGLLILLYYVVILVVETAHTGTPFGRRFDSVWAPIRLVMAIALLVPINYGMNSAQYITLYAAKLGSNFATNGWKRFNLALGGVTVSPLGWTVPVAGGAPGPQEYMLVRVQQPDITSIIQFMTLVKTCKVAYEAARPGWQIRPYFVKLDAAGSQRLDISTGTPAPTYDDPNNWANPNTGIGFYGYKDILIRFGRFNDVEYRSEAGNVKPLCGEIVVPALNTTIPGLRIIPQGYFDLILQLWGDAQVDAFAQKAVAIHLTQLGRDPCAVAIANGDVGTCPNPNAGRSADLPGEAYKNALYMAHANAPAASIALARQQMLQNIQFGVPQALLNRGWAGAGIWYNRIAEWNGALVTAARAVPYVSKMPEIMEKVQEQKRANDSNMDANARYEPYMSSNKLVDLAPGELEYARMFSSVYQYWRMTKGAESNEQSGSANIFFNMIKAIFGLDGLFSMRDNVDVHPMAQLVGLGKGIIESAIRNLMTAMAFAAGGGLAEVMDGQSIGAALMAFSNMFVTMATIGLTVGFILYYVLPFMPFIYFFFAVGNWIKGIFEAMVGVPLWALAHLRIDGQGIHGDTALNGYFLIFEIFIRPILTVFGLVAAMSIFAALVRTLNGIFPLVVLNLSGFDNAPAAGGGGIGQEFKRGVVDEFFFTVIYTVIVYMMATSAFKLIDMIPNGIMRWMGAGVQSFGDQAGDAAANLTQYAAIGGATMAGQVAGAMQKGAKLGGNVLGTPFGLAMERLAAGKSTATEVRGFGSQGQGRAGSDRAPDSDPTP